MTKQKSFRPIILLVEMDEEVRPLIEYNLNHQGYTVIVTTSEEDALERIKDDRPHPDLILLNQVGYSIDEFLEMGRRIRERSSSSVDIPIVVIAEQYEMVMEGKNIEVSDNSFVTYTEDSQQILDLLAQLCSAE